MGSGPPIPASGYTGAPGTSIGGCRERVDLDGPTVSPETRRKLRDVPQCSAAGLRRVVAGFAGPHAATATLAGPGYRRTLRLLPAENGAYLFVLRSTSRSPPRLSITERNGKVCRPLLRVRLETACQRAASAANSDLLRRPGLSQGHAVVEGPLRGHHGTSVVRVTARSR